MNINVKVPDSEIPKITKETFNILKYQFGYNARIGSIIELIEKSTGVSLDIDFKARWNPVIFSELIDFQKKFIESGIDLEDFRDYIYKTFELPQSLIRILNKNNIEDRLWAIMLSIVLPSHDYFKL